MIVDDHFLPLGVTNSGTAEILGIAVRPLKNEKYQ
jgi:hypothetical protein